MTKSSKNNNTNRLQVAFFLNFGFAIIEFIGGIITNSVALMSDAVHDMGDSISIAISWFFNKKSNQKPNQRYTYGYGRYSLLGGLVTAAFLVFGLVFVLYKAIPRLLSPEEIKVTWLMGFAVFGLLVNGYAAFTTSKGSTLNEKMVTLHLLEDVLGWAVLLVSSIFMYFFDIPILDPILSIGYAVFILIQVFKNIKKIIEIMMEKAPASIDLDALRQKLIQLEGVEGVHHIHIWTLDGSRMMMTFHAVLQQDLEKETIIEIQHQLHHIVAEAGIHHATIELELDQICDEETCGISEIEIHDHHHHHHHH